jgi:hypothetical protein
MARGWTERRLYLHSLHAHRGPEAVSDYRGMFEGLAEASVRQRAITTKKSPWSSTYGEPKQKTSQNSSPLRDGRD